MKIYADHSVRRARQLTGDVLLVLWVLLWIKIGSVVHDATMLLARPGEQIASAADGLAGRLRDAGATVAGIPLVGDDVATPFQGAGDAAERIARAGTAQAAAAEHLAFWLGLAVAAIPVLIALAVHLPPRIRFVREATAGQRFLDASADLDLFALRAMANQPMHRLSRITDDPVGAWRRGDRTVITALAGLELRDRGMRLPAAVQQRATRPR